jgi:putative tryptophan/tyrosine transport system substrate-binding protein
VWYLQVAFGVVLRLEAPMKRRDFITLLGGAAAAWPLAARAQQTGKVWRIGYVAGVSRSAASGSYAAFVQGMRELGYVEGKDFVIEWRSVEGRYERFPEIAAELMRLKVDIFVTGVTAALPALQRATTTLPIVMAYSTDPVGNGLVASLVHPGGNITGLAGSSDDSSPKQLELLTTIVPNVSRIGLLGNPDTETYSSVLNNAQDSQFVTVLSGVGGSVNRRMKDYDLIPVGGSVTTFALMPE